MLNIWQRYQQSHPETADIVENGLDKLRDYIDRLDNVPAYTIARCCGDELDQQRECNSDVQSLNAASERVLYCHDLKFAGCDL